MTALQDSLWSTIWQLGNPLSL